MFQGNKKKMPGLSEQIWRAFVFSVLPFYSVSLPSDEPEEIVSPLPSSTRHCLSCNNYELIIDGDGRLEAVAWCVCSDEEEDWTLCQCSSCVPDLQFPFFFILYVPYAIFIYFLCNISTHILSKPGGHSFLANCLSVLRT